MNISHDYYLGVWTVTLHHLLGWSEEDVKLWAHKWSGFREDSGTFYHEPPSHYAVLPIIGAPHRQVSTATLTRIERVLNKAEAAIANRQQFDWSEVKRVIDGILAEGAELDSDPEL